MKNDKVSERNRQITNKNNSTSKNSVKDKKNDTSLNDEPLYLKKEKTSNYMIKDGLFTAIKTGFTESYIMPFAIAMNASAAMLASIASIPELVGAFFQLFSQESLKFFKTRKNILVWTAFFQAVMWLPLIFIPFFAKGAIWLILIFATLEKTIGAFQGPIFNSVIGDIISEDKRGEFFGKRNSVVNLISFISTFVAGLMLSYFKGLDKVGTASYIFIGFGILFFVAFISRSISSYYKSKFYYPEFTTKKTSINFFDFVKNMTHNNYGIFVLYVFMFKLAASISMPFFALYILKDLNMSYFYFTIILGSSIMASFLAMGFWGRQIDKHGSKRVLTIAGFLVPLSPILMIVAIYIKNPLFAFIYLILEEAYSGIMWAGFNISTSSFLYDATGKDDRIKYISYYNLLIGLSVFLGATIGGSLIDKVPFWIVSGIPTILLITGILRMISTIIMIRRVREARMVEVDFPGRGFFHKVISITPHYGSNVEIVGEYVGKKHLSFHNPIQIRRKTIDPVMPQERKLYEKKSFEYYRDNAIKTMNQKSKEPMQKDDSDKIESKIETDQKKISDLTKSIQKDQIKEK